MGGLDGVKEGNRNGVLPKDWGQGARGVTTYHSTTVDASRLTRKPRDFTACSESTHEELHISQQHMMELDFFF